MQEGVGRIARSIFFTRQEDNVCSKQEEVLALARKMVFVHNNRREGRVNGIDTGK